VAGRHAIVPLGVHLPDDHRLRPLRPDVAAAREVARGISDPREAWRALGLEERADRVFRMVEEKCATPPWRDVSRFTPNFDGGPAGLLRCAVLDQPYPHAVENAVAFASDAANILLVEDAARAYTRAMTAWTCREPETRIAWRFLRLHEAIPRQAGTSDLAIVEECLEQALEHAGAPLHYEGGRRVETLGILWHEACSRDLTVPDALDDHYGIHGAAGPPWIPDLLQGARFAELPNPVGCLEQIASLGYALELADGDTIVLLGAALR
jgi:hypothetical protein